MPKKLIPNSPCTNRWHLHVSCAAGTPHATVAAGLFVPTLRGFAGDPCTLSTQAKASHSRDRARKGSATLLLLQGGGTALMLRIWCLALIQVAPSCVSGWSALLARHPSLCLAKSHTLTSPRSHGWMCQWLPEPSALGRISWKKQLQCWLLYSQGCPDPNLLGFAVSKRQCQPMHRSSLTPSQPGAAALTVRRADLPGHVLPRAGWREAGRGNCRGEPCANNCWSMAGGCRSWSSQWSAGCLPQLLSHPQCPHTRDIPCLNLLGLQAERLSRCLISSLRLHNPNPVYTLNYTPPENAPFR